MKIKKLTAMLLSAVLAVSCFVSCGNKDEDTQKATWDELNQTEMTSAMALGWNLGNQLEASSSTVPSETAWGNPEITKDLIDAVKAQGFTTIRIPVSYLSMIGDGPDYKVDEDWLNRVAEVVDYVVDNDMYAVINMHGDGYYTVDGGWLLCAEDEQDDIKAKYKAVWKQIAEKFNDYDEHLVFESMNEEFNNQYGLPLSSAYENINAYNQIFVDTVRETGGNNAKRWLLIPGWNTNIEYTAGDFGFVIPTDDKCESDSKRLMISVHFYDPYNFTLDESEDSMKLQWGEYATESVDNWGQEDYVDTQMALLNEKFVSQGYPVIIGEMGVTDKSFTYTSSNEFRRYWCEYVVKSAKANGVIPIYWDNGYNGPKGFGLFDRDDCSVTQQGIIDGMVRAITTDGDYDVPAPVISDETVSSVADEGFAG